MPADFVANRLTLQFCTHRLNMDTVESDKYVNNLRYILYSRLWAGTA